MMIRDAWSCSLDVGAPRHSRVLICTPRGGRDVSSAECSRLHWRCVTRRYSTNTALTLFDYMRVMILGRLASFVEAEASREEGSCVKPHETSGPTR
eukprot:2798175-Prymnesium_polylepis.1